MVAKEKVLDAVEKTIDATEETLETIERIPNLNLNGTTKKQQTIILTATAIVSLVAGGGLTYLVTNHRLKTRYEKIAEHEIEETRRHYKLLMKKDEFDDPISAVEHLSAKLKDLGYKVEGPVESEAELLAAATEVDAPPDQPTDEFQEISAEQSDQAEHPAKVTPISQNIFEQHGKANRTNYSNFDYDVEVSQRSEAFPYIITEEEYLANENDWDQQELTYYAGDGVLTDQRDQPINETDIVVGEGNLLRFGHGSRNPSTLHVRNERLELEFEIARSKMSYTESLGFNEPELRHSEKRGGTRRFRDNDG